MASAEPGRRPRLLLLTLIFPPDGVSTAQLLGEIAEDLHHEFEVSVITTSPHYNVDEDARQSQRISWRWHRLVGDSQFGQIRVSHVRMPTKAKGRVARALQWLWFHVASLLMGASRRRSIDAVLCASPPPTVAIVARMLARLSNAPFVFAVWELYPEILVKLGKIKRGSLMHRLLQGIERMTYEKASVITVLHEPMRQVIIHVDPSLADRVRVVPTFADTEMLQPMERTTPLRESLDLGDQFVVGYAGNLGESQDLSDLVQAAGQLRSDQDLAVVLVGDGNDRQRLEHLASALDATNVIFTGYLPFSRMPEVTATFDVAVVALSTSVGAEALPSKVYRLMSCGRPILALTDEETPLAHLVRRLEIGVVVPPGDPTAVAEAVLRLRQSPADRLAMGERARAAVLEHFARPVVTGQYAAALHELTAIREASS